MKIVVFGPQRRVGALRGDYVVDLSGACAKLLRERQNEHHPTLLAAALVPSDLAAFIEGGTRSLEQAEAALAYLSDAAYDQLGVAARGIQRAAARAAAKRIAHRLRGWQFRRPSCGHGRDGPAAGRWRDVDRAGRGAHP